MKIAMRFYVTALFAIAVGTAFAQGTDDSAYKQRVADAAAKYKSGNMSGAMSDFMALYGENSKNADVNSWLGFLNLRNKDSKKAISFLEQAKALNPKDLEVLNNLGNAYVMEGNNTKALSTYQELIALDGKRFQAYYNIGNIQLENKRYPQAEASFTRALGLDSNLAQVYNNLGVAQEAQDKFDKAGTSFQKASDLEPKSATYARNAGGVMYKAKNYSGAITYFERAIKNGSNDKNVILALGDSYGKSGRKADLTRLYDAHQDTFAGDSKYYYNLGVMKRQDRDLDGAEDAFKKAISINEKDTASLSNLGVIQFNRGNYSDARNTFEKLSALEPTVQNKKNFAAAASREGDYRAAMPVWSEILRSTPGDQDVRLLLADALYDSNDTKAAMTMYKQILGAKPNSAEALDGIGRCHLRDAKYSDAEAALRRALKADNSFVPAYNNLAVVLEKMNKRKEAISLLEKAASMDENNADVQKNLKRMRSAG